MRVNYERSNFRGRLRGSRMANQTAILTRLSEKNWMKKVVEKKR